MNNPTPKPPEKPSGLKTLRYAEKRNAILRSAVRLFNEHGVRGTGLKEVAGNVGLATNSVTYYYKKKEDLASACYLRAIEAHDKIFLQAKIGHNVDQCIKICLERYFDFLKDVAIGETDPVIFFDEIRSLNDENSRTVFGAYTQMFRNARSLLIDSESEKVSRMALNARTHLLLSVLFWVPAWIHRYEPEDFGRLAGSIHDILINGLAGESASWRTPDVTEEAFYLDEDQTEVTNKAYLRAASELINENGYHGASVDRISARLSVTKGSFYHHNNNKDDLVVNCFEHTFDVLKTAQNACSTGTGSSWQKLGIAAATLIAHQFSKQGPLLRTTALHAVPEPIRKQMALRMNRISDRFATFIVDGMRDRSVRIVDPIVAGQMINPMINGGADLNRWAPNITLEEALSFYVKPLFMGFKADEADC